LCAQIAQAFSREKQVGQVHFETVTLQQMMAMSPVIVHARRKTAAPIQNKFQPGAPVEPYEYGEKTYGIIEILRGPKDLACNNEIVVTGFDPALLRLHIDYYLRGLSRSPVFPHYKPEHPVKPGNDDESILFLKPIAFLLRDDTGNLTIEVSALAPACRGAHEAPLREKDIRSRLKVHPAPERIEITIGLYHNCSDNEETGLGEALKSLFPGFTSYSWKTVNIGDAP
jgi:hypothetical protein